MTLTIDRPHDDEGCAPRENCRLSTVNSIGALCSVFCVLSATPPGAERSASEARLKVGLEGTEETLDMADAPFDRVDNGYDPNQVAAFAAQALSWKRELAETRSALARYERIIGEIDEVEREAARIVDEARVEAEKIIEHARARVELPHQLAGPQVEVDDVTEFDEEHVVLSREEKIEAAREHLYRRRGVILPQE